MKSLILFAGVVAFSGSAYAQGINDAQVAAIVVTANQIDIDAGQVAATRATSDAVRKFAQAMVRDHTNVNRLATELAGKLNLKPEPNATSETLKKSAAATMAKLKSLSGAEFDRAYIDHEVSYHQTVLDALDKTLIPGASNAELKALLVKSRPAFAAHLEHAKAVQKDVAAVQ